MAAEKGFDRFMVVTTPVLQGMGIEEYLGPVIVSHMLAVIAIRGTSPRASGVSSAGAC